MISWISYLSKKKISLYFLHYPFLSGDSRLPGTRWWWHPLSRALVWRPGSWPRTTPTSPPVTATISLPLSRPVGWCDRSPTDWRCHLTPQSLCQVTWSRLTGPLSQGSRSLEPQGPKTCLRFILINRTFCSGGQNQTRALAWSLSGFVKTVYLTLVN